MSDIFQIAIILFILCGIGVAIWRSGQANPESTGKLARRIGRVETELADKATKKDVAAVSSKVTELKAEMEGDRRVNQMTYEAIRRVESYLIQKGLGS